MNWTVGEVMRRESRSWRCMRHLVKYFNPGVCQAWQEWVKRHEKSLIWSLQVLNLTCLERVYNWFLDIGNTATVKRQLSSQAIEAENKVFGIILITTLIIILTPGTISKHPGPTWHGTNWYHLTLPCTTWHHLAPSQTILDHPVSSWTIWVSYRTVKNTETILPDEIHHSQNIWSQSSANNLGTRWHNLYWL